MIRAACVRDRQGCESIFLCRPQHIFERSKPRLEDRTHFFGTLQIDSADLAGSVVQIEIARDFFTIRLELELRSLWRALFTRRWRTRREARFTANPLAEVIGHISA